METGLYNIITTLDDYNRKLTPSKPFSIYLDIYQHTDMVDYFY